MNNCYLTRLLSLVVFLSTSFTLTFGQLTVDAPVSVAGSYNSGIAVFGPLYSFSGLVVPVVDDDGLTTACVPIANAAEVAGNVALIDRGVCGFAIKAQAAEDAGAIAVIICNNDQANPDAVIRMGGTDNCALTIPTISMSYNDCQTIRVETGVMVTLNAPEGSTIDSAFDIGEGTFTADGISGIENLFTGATADLYYRYVASAQGVLNINSCGGGTDTRLIVVTASGACRTELLASVALITFSDDDCDDGAGNIVASDATLIVNEGDELYIIWDNAHSNDGFDFTVTLSDLPTVNTTFNVLMTNEMVSNDGVQMIWAYPGATSLDDVFVEAMTDNGDGSWSATIALTTLDTIGYAFVNGDVLAGGLIEEVPEECGVDGGFGFDVRPYIETMLEDHVGGTSCFGTCSDVCELDCADPLVLIFDDFESYTAGQQPSAPHIIPWPGTSNLGLVSDEVAFSGSNSHRVTGTGTDVDPVYLLGDQTAGHFIVSWRMYVPAGNSAYYNFQKTATPGTQWAFQLHFDPDGTARLEAGSANAANPRATFTYTPGAWMLLTHIIDVDNNMVRFFHNNQFISSWPLNWQPFAQTGLQQFAGVNFYPSNNTFLYFIDDFRFVRIPEAAEGLYCQSAAVLDTAGVYAVAEFSCFGGGYNVRANGVNGARAAWFTYTPEEDGWISVGSCGSESDTRVWLFTGSGCTDLVVVGINDDRCEQSNGDPYASYREAVVTAGTTYYIMWDNVWDNTGFEFELTFSPEDLEPGNFCQSAIEVIPGTYTVESFADASVAGPNIGFLTTSTTPYSGAWWYSYTADANAIVNINSCLGDGADTYLFVYTGSCDNFSTLELVASNDDSCGASSEVEFEATAGTTYYIEWIDRFSSAPFYWELRVALPGDVCGDALDISDQFGGAQGISMISGPYDNTDNSTSDADPDFGWECFGEPDGSGTAPSLERTRWFTFVGDGATYLIESFGCGDDPIDSDDTQMAIYSGDCGTLTAVACNDDLDLAGGLYYSSIELETEEDVTYYVMIDGFGPAFPADGEFCIEVTRVSAVASNVTFRVNATAITVAPEGILLSGAFNGWPGSGTPMEDQGNGVWALTLPLLPGDYEYKFQNGPNGWEEGMTGDCVTGDFGNRIITVGDEDLVLDIFCFESCDFPFPDGNCFVSVDEQTLRSGVSIFPNPFKDVVNVRFELATAAENLNIRVVNSIGQTVYTKRLGQIMAENVEIDMKDLPAGAYLVQIIDGEAQVVKTVVKQ
jgi:hypothetical protein